MGALELQLKNPRIHPPYDSVTLIVPVYNELASLPEILLKLASLVTKLGADAACILSDDGSTDGSADFLERSRAAYPWLTVVSSRVNRGKSAALTDGLAAAKGRIILMMDGDLQNDPDDFLPMLEAMESGRLDGVAGWRRSRKDAPLKTMLSRLYNLALNLLFSMNLHDHNCGIKAVRKEALDRLPLRGEWHRYLTVLMHAAGYAVGEIPVRHYPRRHGRSRYGIGRYWEFLGGLPSLIRQARLLRKNAAHGSPSK